VNGRFLSLVAATSLAGCGGSDPGSGAGPGGPTGPTAAQAAWLDPHNAVRAGTFAGVTVSPVPLPALPALTWSASAAAVAQAWADGCTYAHNPGRGADGTPRGENIAASSTGYWGTPAGVVGAWASEWPDYTYSTNACAAGKVCGHYTQLVWRATLRVGCAKAACSVNSPFAGFPNWEFYVCDYEPPGNWSGQRPY
jgi:hypothetical protein